MRHVEPYRTERGLLQALDNGGRFYNLFTRAGDHRITRAELARAAGAAGSAQQAVLFFEMAQVGLPRAARDRAVAELERTAAADYWTFKPAVLKPSELDAAGRAGQSAIVEGHPRFLRDRSQFSGMMMLPISSSGVTTFSMVPLYDQFHVYEVFDDGAGRPPGCIVASARNVDLAEDRPVRFGGMLETMESEEAAERRHRYYLKAVYYTRL